MRRVRQSGWIVLLAAACVVPLSGCTSFRDYVHNGFKVGPNYCPPPAPVAQHWIDQADLRCERDPETLSRWWSVFTDPVLQEQDPVLNCLIHIASQQNLTLREAGCRVLQARAQRAIAVGNLFPQQQDAFGDYRRIGASVDPSGGLVSGRFSDRWDFGFNLSWELDFWGRFRRAVASADDTLQASVADYDFVLVTLLGDVGANYLQIRTNQEQIRLVEENVELQERVAKFFRDRAAASYGTDVRIDNDQAQSVLMQTKAQIPQLQIDMRQANDQLCTLLGIPTVDLCEAMALWKSVDQRKLEELNRRKAETVRKLEALANKLELGLPVLPEDLVKPERPRPIYIPIVPPANETAVGIPADLLRQRPDVHRAERQAAAQAEEIGIALADLYPAFTINGTLGYQAKNFPDLFRQTGFNGSVGPSFQWNVLNYGRIVNNARFQDAKFQELVAAYQNTVLQANQEVEDGLVTYLRSDARTNLFAEGVMNLRDAVICVTLQKERGKIDVNRYSVVAQNLVQQESTWAVARGQIAQGLIAVYRSLGGGWQIRLGGNGDGNPPAEAQPNTGNPAEPVPTPQPDASDANGVSRIPLPAPEPPPAAAPDQPSTLP